LGNPISHCLNQDLGTIWLDKVSPRLRRGGAGTTGKAVFLIAAMLISQNNAATGPTRNAV
jgi:hypothetical protein